MTIDCNTCGEGHGRIETRVDGHDREIKESKAWQVQHEQNHIDDLRQRNKNWGYWVGTSMLAVASIAINLITSCHK